MTIHDQTRTQRNVPFMDKVKCKATPIKATDDTILCWNRTHEAHDEG